MKVYLDNAASSKPYREVINEVSNSMDLYYGNPSASHSFGYECEKQINAARNYLGKSINASFDEIIFNSGGTESNNFLIRGFVNSGNHIITSNVEHSSVLNTFKYLESLGIEVTYLPVNENGMVNLDALKNSIKKNTVLASFMHVNNEIGTINNLEEIGNIINNSSKRVKFHVDAVQSYGKLQIDVKKCNISLLSVSAHKFHGPRGIGFSYVKKGLNPKSLIFGGGQEYNFRSGTENTYGIMGMKKAAEIMNENIRKNYVYVGELKKYFIERLSEIDNIKINSPINENFSNYILNVSFVGIKGEVLLHFLEERHIYVSTGSACSSNDNKKINKLNYINLNSEEINGAIRFSFSEENKIEEIDYTINNLKEGLRLLRRKV